MYIDRIDIDRSKIPEDEEDAYIFELPALRNFKSLTLKKPVTFLVGENGTGKSTLLEAIAVGYGFNPEGGSKNFNFSTLKSHSKLFQAMRFTKSAFPKDGYFLRAESFYNLATNIDEMDRQGAGLPSITRNYGGRSLHEQSHGESFLALVVNRFWGKGLYILDEPEAALSPTRQLSLIAKMGELINDHSHRQHCYFGGLSSWASMNISLIAPVCEPRTAILKAPRLAQSHQGLAASLLPWLLDELWL